MGAFKAVTRGLSVEVESFYVAENSTPSEEHYFFAYHVTIVNEGETPVQLVSRRWVITDANGHEEIVEGEGVVGEQPMLAPGEGFQYTSFCPLSTPAGTMSGTYRMIDSKGQEFDAEIPVFSLNVPGSLN
ncbi:Co2+/Mg2+ efflux protein ApaG [bacterium]|nr:Co2+/Mg2+ efflux protein ApaG [bacterium]